MTDSASRSIYKRLWFWVIIAVVLAFILDRALGLEVLRGLGLTLILAGLGGLTLAWFQDRAASSANVAGWLIEMLSNTLLVFASVVVIVVGVVIFLIDVVTALSP